MKKFVLAALVLFVTAGLTIAAVVTVVKVEEKDGKITKITVKDDKDKESTYTIKEGLVIKGGKGGDMDVTERTMKGIIKGAEGGKLKLDITVEKDVITDLKMVRTKMKDKN